MAKKYVSRAVVIRNGKRQSDLKNFKVGELAYRGEVDTMDGSGSTGKAKKHRFSFDYAIPKTAAKLDWSDVEDETWIIELDGGRRITFSGVDCLTRGEFITDAEKETVMPLSFIALSEDIE